MYPPFPPGFQLGPLSIHWYGVTMVTAIFVCALIASRYVTRHGQDSNNIWNMLLWVVIPAIIGARLYYVFIQAPRGPNGLDSYLAHPLEILEIWRGGIHIYGALIGGGIALLIYVYVKKIPALIYLDAVGLALPLGQAIGRLGNFINQELYGPPTTLPWGLRIDPANRLAPYNNLSLYPESVRFQPLFLYEMIWNLIGFTLIFWLARRFEKKLRDGDIVLIYLIWYPLGRFFLEFFRTDSWFFPGTPFDLVHLLSAIVIVTSIALLIIRHRNWSVATTPQSSSVVLSNGEEAVQGSGLDMSEEYSFMRKDRQTVPEERAAHVEELTEDEMLEDEVAEEESEGIEDIEDWDGESPEEEMMLEEGDEYNKPLARAKDPERESPKAKEEEEPEDEEEELEEEPEDEETEEIVGEEDAAEGAGENEEGEAGEEGGEESISGDGEPEDGGQETEASGTAEGNAEASGDGEDGVENGGQETEANGTAEDSVEDGGKEAEASGAGEGNVEASGTGENGAEDEAVDTEESSEGADEGDADASSDE